MPSRRRFIYIFSFISFFFLFFGWKRKRRAAARARGATKKSNQAEWEREWVCVPRVEQEKKSWISFLESREPHTPRLFVKFLIQTYTMFSVWVSVNSTWSRDWPERRLSEWLGRELCVSRRRHRLPSRALGEANNNNCKIDGQLGCVVQAIVTLSSTLCVIITSAIFLTVE